MESFRTRIHEHYSKPVLDFLQRVGLGIPEIGLHESDFKTAAAKGEHIKADFGSTVQLRYVDNPIVEFLGREIPRRAEHSFEYGSFEGRQVYVNVYEIEQTLKDRTLACFDENPENSPKYSKLESVLMNLLTIANHDYTMHQMGIAPRRRTFGILSEYLISANSRGSDEGINVPIAEQFAIVFHKILFDRALSASPLLQRFISSQLYTFFRIISELPTDLQTLWVTKLKYPVFSLFAPDSPMIKDYILKLQPKLKMLEWIELVNRNEFSLNMFKFYEYQRKSGSKVGILSKLLRLVRPNEVGTVRRVISSEKLFDICYLHAESTDLNIIERRIFESSEIRSSI